MCIWIVHSENFLFLKTLLTSVLLLGKDSGQMTVLEDPWWVSDLAAPYHTLKKVRPAVTGFHTLEPAQQNTSVLHEESFAPEFLAVCGEGSH